ncbi:MAG: hypothetical protein A2X23_00255 [Chloroflexi bacterium GWC2_73_18]|nr:MAG: hypothetical protein A2X23_00255 [Chloroflexi bacterium GWC2_73_18]
MDPPPPGGELPSPPSTPIRILLVDDQTLFRRALAGLISAEPDLEVVAEARDGHEALERVRELRPDLVVMDVQMPVAGGVEGVRLIRELGPQPRIVMLTVSDEDDDLFASVAAGANGYLLKNVDPDVFCDLLRGVMRGEAPISPAIAHKLLAALRGAGPLPGGREEAGSTAPDGGALTPRETEILQLLAGGLTNKEIAARLAIGEGTVKNHVHHALEKLHLSNRAQAAAFAIREGLVPRSQAPG